MNGQFYFKMLLAISIDFMYAFILIFCAKFVKNCQLQSRLSQSSYDAQHKYSVFAENSLSPFFQFHISIGNFFFVTFLPTIYIFIFKVVILVQKPRRKLLLTGIYLFIPNFRTDNVYISLMVHLDNI